MCIQVYGAEVRIKKLYFGGKWFNQFLESHLMCEIGYIIYIILIRYISLLPDVMDWWLDGSE